MTTPTTYRKPGETLPDKLTEDDWRQKDALEVFQHCLSHEQIGPKLPMDMRELLAFAFRCGWNAKGKGGHRRRFVSIIEEVLTEAEHTS